MKKTVVLEIYFPIVFDIRFENYPFEQREIAIEEIFEVVKMIDFSDAKYIEGYEIAARYLKAVASALIHHPNENYLRDNEDCLHFSLALTIDFNEVNATSHDGGKVKPITDVKELQCLLMATLPKEVGEKFFEILMLSQLAHSGSLKLREGVIWLNGKKTWKAIPSPINLREAYEYHLEKTYPIIEFLPFPPFYKWMKENNLLFKDKPTNVLQKAINNFSYLNGRPDTVTGLIYQMMTLEQLYTDSNNGVTEQLNRKIQVFLGPMNTHKNQIKNMYEIRSSFLHGRLPLKAFHQQYDFDDYPEVQTQLSNACNLSILIIIATLQKMYKEGRVDLTFKYALD